MKPNPFASLNHFTVPKNCISILLMPVYGAYGPILVSGLCGCQMKTSRLWCTARRPEQIHVLCWPHLLIACPFLKRPFPTPVLPSPTGYTEFMPTNRPKTPPKAPSVTKPDDGQGAVVAERKSARTKPPRMYKVVMLNDDFTPMEFVVMVLQEYFRLDHEAATQIMLKIHHDGRAVCGVFSKDVAATKVDQVLDAASKAGHPLKCISEPVDR